MDNVIVKALITEKSMDEAKKGKFTFIVSMKASKRHVKNEVEKIFKVNVLSVSSLIIKGRKKRYGTKRIEVNEPSFKKAIVKLKSGQKIDLFDQGA